MGCYARSRSRFNQDRHNKVGPKSRPSKGGPRSLLSIFHAGHKRIARP